MAKGRTCGEINDIRCAVHPSHKCSIVLEPSDSKTAAAIERANEAIEDMGRSWSHGPESTHACRLCSIERKNGFPAGHLVDRDRRRYWVKKDRREKKAGEELARTRGHLLPQSHPMASDRSITPVIPTKTKRRKPSKPARSTAQKQRKSKSGGTK